MVKFNFSGFVGRRFFHDFKRHRGGQGDLLQHPELRQVPVEHEHRGPHAHLHLDHHKHTQSAQPHAGMYDNCDETICLVKSHSQDAAAMTGEVSLLPYASYFFCWLAT